MRPVAEIDVVRDAIFAAVARGRHELDEAMHRDRKLSWNGVELWIDRMRWLVVPDTLARGHGCTDPDDLPQHAQSISIVTSARTSYGDVDGLVDDMARTVGGGDMPDPPASAAAEFITYCVIQPLVNPAFGPLFWLALERDLDSRSLGDVVGALAYDMRQLPEARGADRPRVRAAQIALAERFDPQLDRARWTAATDAEWVAYCDTVLRQSGFAGGLFARVQRRVQQEYELLNPPPRARAVVPTDRIERLEGDRLGFGPFTFVLPAGWDVLEPTTLAIAGALRVSLSRALGAHDLAALTARANTSFTSDDGTPRPVHVETLTIAGQRAIVGSVAGRYAVPAYKNHPARAHPDYQRIAVAIESPIGIYEIMTDGPRPLVTAHESAFGAFAASLELRRQVRFECGPLAFTAPLEWPVRVAPQRRVPDSSLPSELFGDGPYVDTSSLKDWTVAFPGDAVLAAPIATNEGVYQLVFRGPRELIAANEPAFRALSSGPVETAALCEEADGRWSLGPFLLSAPPAAVRDHVAGAFLHRGSVDLRVLAVRQARSWLHDDVLPLSIDYLATAGGRVVIAGARSSEVAVRIAVVNAPEGDYQISLHESPELPASHADAFRNWLGSLVARGGRGDHIFASSSR